MDVLRQCQRPGDLAFRIVIAVQDEDGNIRLIELPHLLGKEQSSLVITPGAIIEVAGDHEKIHLVPDRPFDQRLKCGARRCTNTFSHPPFNAGQSGQRTIEMNIGGMEEAKGGHGEPRQ